MNMYKSRLIWQFLLTCGGFWDIMYRYNYYYAISVCSFSAISFVKNIWKGGCYIEEKDHKSRCFIDDMLDAFSHGNIRMVHVIYGTRC